MISFDSGSARTAFWLGAAVICLGLLGPGTVEAGKKKEAEKSGHLSL